jgi:hypothetical protein
MNAGAKRAAADIEQAMVRLEAMLEHEFELKPTELVPQGARALAMRPALELLARERLRVVLARHRSPLGHGGQHRRRRTAAVE